MGYVLSSFGSKRIKPEELDPSKPARHAVAELIKAARAQGGNVAGAVARHVVGALLSLRFPEVHITNETYTTVDQQTDRPGDFLVGDTAIYVTMSPSENLISSRCGANIQNGYRVIVIVPENRVAMTQLLAENVDLGDRISVSNIEEFVGTNIEKIASFYAAEIRTGLKALLERYNERVRLTEPDPSLQIEIPRNL